MWQSVQAVGFGDTTVIEGGGGADSAGEVGNFRSGRVGIWGRARLVCIVCGVGLLFRV